MDNFLFFLKSKQSFNNFFFGRRVAEPYIVEIKNEKEDIVIFCFINILSKKLNYICKN